MATENYIQSIDVFVFPSSERGIIQSDARIFYEKNTTNLINQLLGKDSFVITPEFDEANSFRFNIKGYYFEIKTGALIVRFAKTSDTNIYAKIKIVTNNNMPELQGTDESNFYKGLEIVSSVSEDTNEGYVYLHILQKAGTSWVIPDESRIQFIKQNGTTISNSSLINPTMINGTLSDSTLSGNNFNEGTLSGGTLKPDSIECSSINGTITKGSEFTEGFINQSDITGGTITGSTIQQVSISTIDEAFKTRIGSAELNEDGSIDNAELNNVTISGGSANTIDISDANINGSTINGGTIISSELQNITMTATSGSRNQLDSCVIQSSEIDSSIISGCTIDSIDGGVIA